MRQGDRQLIKIGKIQLDEVAIHHYLDVIRREIIMLVGDDTQDCGGELRKSLSAAKFDHGPGVYRIDLGQHTRVVFGRFEVGEDIVAELCGEYCTR